MAKRSLGTKPAKVSYRLLTREDHRPMYQRLDAIVIAHHEELRDARIALAWCTSWRPDVDGNVTIGRCKRASALDRELHEWDFVILLNERFWTDEQTTAIQQDALLDHELCHATVKLDTQTNDPALDERGRVVYRLRRHDLEEFACIAQRYGLWKRDLQVFAKALKNGPQVRLPLDQDPAAPQLGPPGALMRRGPFWLVVPPTVEDLGELLMAHDAGPEVAIRIAQRGVPYYGPGASWWPPPVRPLRE